MTDSLDLTLVFTLTVTSFLFCYNFSSARHHLLYFYTALTKPDGFSGPVFSAVGVCEDRRISRYSNEEQTWKRDCLDAEIWRNTKEPRDPRDWFLHQVNALANCTNSICDGLHTLQRRVGCEVEKCPDGSVIHVNAFDEYGYDGEQFIAFNSATMQWIEKTPKAKETRMKWNNQRVRRQVLQMVLKNCMNWISTFNDSVRGMHSSPVLHMFASVAPRDQSKQILTCLATGFYPKLIEMNITLNNITLQPFSSSEVRPNDDQTFQIRTSVKIHRDEKRGYECRVLQSNRTYTTSWGKYDHITSQKHHYLLEGLIAVAVVFAVAVLLIMLLIYKGINGEFILIKGIKCHISRCVALDLM
uniref:Immunoglobulin C1-set domain-containing protein n=1 Tax=Sinocyclocheilus anshuiensis TaxID=1608454 RepID=A0A671MJF2_9TELE